MFRFAFCWFCHVGFLALQKAKRANRVQKVLRFAMQRPANYLTEIETYLEKALAEALEGEKTA